MNKSTKAALLSAFLLPGAGHFWLKRYIHGTVLFVFFVSAFCVLLFNAIKQAKLIAQKIIDGHLEFDLPVILEVVQNQLHHNENLLLEVSSAALIVVWLIGIFHSYYLGRLCD